MRGIGDNCSQPSVPSYSVIRSFDGQSVPSRGYLGHWGDQSYYSLTPESDAQHIRDTLTALQLDYRKMHAQYMQSMERWKAREARMRRIIQKQQRVINRLSGAPANANEARRDNPPTPTSCSSYDSSSYSIERTMLVPPPRVLIPPWDVDMDDIRQQLQDLDESVIRVGQAKANLSGTSVARSELRLNYEDNRLTTIKTTQPPSTR